MNYFFNDLFKLISNPKKYFEMKKILSEIETTLDKEFGTDIVVLTKQDYDQIMVKNNSSSLVKNNPSHLNTEVIYDNYGNDSYYHDDDIFLDDINMPFNDNKFNLDTDSVYNFAVLYLFGNRYSNYMTIFSLDEKDQLYIYKQKQFKIKTHLDLINICEDSIKRYELDSLIFVETDIMKSIYNNVINGIESDIKIETILCKEFTHFNDQVKALVPLINNGNVLVNAGEPWYIALQNEINNYFQEHVLPQSLQKASLSILLPYPKLKSMIYGVNHWYMHKNTTNLQRNFNG